MPDCGINLRGAGCPGDPGGDFLVPSDQSDASGGRPEQCGEHLDLPSVEYASSLQTVSFAPVRARVSYPFRFPFREIQAHFLRLLKTFAYIKRNRPISI